MSEHQHYAMVVIERQHEHYIKLLDIFETRQTWAFNFAILLYGGGFSVLGVLFDKIYALNVPHVDPVVAGLVVLSFALPVLMLPLCFLYADVSVFCAALTEGNLEHFNRNAEPCSATCRNTGGQARLPSTGSAD